jgi:ABC-type Fe3+-hydroxamate transport system substrate-binding protein
MTASSPGRITSATTSTSDCWALWRGGGQYRDRKFLERFGGGGVLAAGKFTLNAFTLKGGVEHLGSKEPDAGPFKIASYSGARGSIFPPRRIVCLTEETVETLYLLGEQDRIVGISGYVVRPPRARREKPRVSAFTSANIDKILALRPDLVLTFSDLQADIAADLIRHGLNLHAFNQRSVAGILDMIGMLGAMVDASDRAEQLVGTLEARLAEARHRTGCLTRRSGTTR